MQTKAIHSEGERFVGKQAQQNNILAAKTVSDIIKTTLGPRGMDKMLVTPEGNIIITNDGVTILSEMEIEHPAAKMMVEIAKTQELEAGDGTTTAVMIAGKLLENAEKLIEKKIHPTIITQGYRLAQKEVQRLLKENSFKITLGDKEILKHIALTSMTGKSAENFKEELSEVVIESIKLVGGENKINLKNIKIEKILGKETNKTELIKGIVFDKEKLSEDMPKKINNAKILLLDFSVETRSPEARTNISIHNHSELQGFIEGEEKSLKEIVQKIIESGANVLFCQKGVDDYASYLLSKAGIYVCRRVMRSDLEKIAKATNGKIISNFEEISCDILGESGEVEEIAHSNKKMTYVNRCKNPLAVTILIYGGANHVLDEIERAIFDALYGVVSAIETNLVVLGGGSIEIELSKGLKEFSKKISGREKFAIEEFASALEFIPITLAENAGLDSIDILTEMIKRHENGEKLIGLNLFTNKVENVLESKIIESYKVKYQAINSAVDVATMILRIDDVILAKPIKEKEENLMNIN